MTATRIPGMDISHWDYDKGLTRGTAIADVIAQGIQFIIAKVGYASGGNQNDPAWAFHKARLKEHPEIQKGGYWYPRINGTSMQDQCDFFIESMNVNGDLDGWLVAFDFEEVDADKYHEPRPNFNHLEALAARFWENCPGHDLLFYTRKTYMSAVLSGDAHALGCKLWNAVGVAQMVDGTTESTAYLNNYDQYAARLAFGYNGGTNPYSGNYCGFNGPNATTIVQPGSIHADQHTFDGDCFNGSLAQLRLLAQSNLGPNQPVKVTLPTLNIPVALPQIAKAGPPGTVVVAPPVVVTLPHLAIRLKLRTAGFAAGTPLPQSSAVITHDPSSAVIS